jgi:hypothetical protein
MEYIHTKLLALSHYIVLSLPYTVVQHVEKRYKLSSFPGSSGIL